METFQEILSIVAVLLLIVQRIVALWRDYKQWRKERDKEIGD